MIIRGGDESRKGQAKGELRKIKINKKTFICSGGAIEKFLHAFLV